MAPAAPTTQSLWFCFWSETLVCLGVGVGGMYSLGMRGNPWEAIGLLIVWCYGLFRTVAPLFEKHTAESRLLELGNAHRQGLLIGQLCLPLVFASELIATPFGDPDRPDMLLSFWMVVCCSIHATVIMKSSRYESDASAFFSVLGLSTGVWYFVLGRGLLQLLVAVALFHYLFKLRAMYLPEAVSRGMAVIIAEAACHALLQAVVYLVWVLGLIPASPLWTALIQSPELAHPVTAVVRVLFAGTFVMVVVIAPSLGELQYLAPSKAADAAVLFDKERNRSRGGMWAKERRRRTRSLSEDASQAPMSPHEPSIEPKLIASLWLRIVGVLACIVFPWMAVVLGFQNPFMWLIHFLIDEPLRLLFAAYWAALLLAIVAWHPTAASLGVPNIVVRKVYHGVALCMFVPALLLQYDMMMLSFTIAFAMLCLIELIRLLQLPPFGRAIHHFMTVYVDEKDAGPFILTHIYLLIGCAGPVWLSGYAHTTNPYGVMPFAGLIIIGVGDAAAAIIGSQFGNQMWPGTKKTLLGTTAAIVAICGSIVIIDALQGFVCDSCIPMMPQSLKQGVKMLLACIAAAFMESFTMQVDNLVLPLYFYAFLRVVHAAD